MTAVRQQLTLDLTPKLERCFETFVPGANGALVAHLKALRSGDAPTLLWGPVGSGKTHLLQALARHWPSTRATAGVQIFDSRAHPFGVLSPSTRLVLMDDVDQLDADQQQAAFGVFISAVEQGAAVVAASRVPAADMSLRDDLRTRLAWGLVFALHPLGDDALRVLLRQEGLRRGLALPEELLEHLLLRFARDTTCLVPLLARLDEYALRRKRAPTVPLLREMLNEEEQADTF